MVLKYLYLKSNRPAAEVKQESPGVTMVAMPRNAEQFGAFPENRNYAYELEFPVPGYHPYLLATPASLHDIPVEPFPRCGNCASERGFSKCRDRFRVGGSESQALWNECL